MIPYGRQVVDEVDIAAVVEVLRGDWLTQGPVIPKFEEAVATYVGAKHAVAFSSGTAALHGAAWAAGLGPGDIVVTSPLTFMASANCARYVGATPALVDISPQTWNLDLSLVPEEASAVVAVHFAGLPVDLADPGWTKRPRVVIEDAAHALGAHTPDGPVGNCAHSDMCCFSFHPVKPITTGEGGIVTTNSDPYAEALRTFRSHGIVRRPDVAGWHYEIEDVGFNYRMTEMQAALGLSQLAKLDRFVKRRNEIALLYRDWLADIPIDLPPKSAPGFRHGYHLFPIGISERRASYNYLQGSGIGVQVHYVPIHHHPISKNISVYGNDLQVCESVYSKILSLPIFPSLSDSQVKFVVEEIQKVVDLYS